MPWSIAALEAGKHVLCEKPLARDPAQVELAFDAAERAGRVLMEAFMWRFHPQTDELVRLVREGAVGDVRYVHAAFAFGGIGGENVRLQAALEGGALMDVGCYCVSALRLLCGEPERVSGEQVTGGDGVDIRFAGVPALRRRRARDLRLRHGRPPPPGHPDRRLGGLDPRAAAVADVGGPEDPRSSATRSRRSSRPGVDPVRAPSWTSWPPRSPSGREPRLGRAESVGQARTIEALYRAAAEGRSVTL